MTILMMIVIVVNVIVLGYDDFADRKAWTERQRSDEIVFGSERRRSDHR